jgi:hypothetical protein
MVYAHYGIKGKAARHFFVLLVYRNEIQGSRNTVFVFEFLCQKLTVFSVLEKYASSCPVIYSWLATLECQYFGLRDRTYYVDLTRTKNFFFKYCTSQKHVLCEFLYLFSFLILNSKKNISRYCPFKVCSIQGAWCVLCASVYLAKRRGEFTEHGVRVTWVGVCWGGGASREKWPVIFSETTNGANFHTRQEIPPSVIWSLCTYSIVSTVLTIIEENFKQNDDKKLRCSL